MRNFAIIVAGGTGNRMKTIIPKQFLLLQGKPIIQFSVEAFYQFNPQIEIIIAIHPDYFQIWEQLDLFCHLPMAHQVVAGGETRFQSVKNGLRLIKEDGLVAIHDAARPLIHAGFIENLFSEAQTYGSALPCIAVNETIRMILGNSSQQLDRNLLRAMQTPQVFKVSELKQAYIQEFQNVFTDDATVMQAAGYDLHLCEGLHKNIKITHPEDIKIAEMLFHSL